MTDALFVNFTVWLVLGLTIHIYGSILVACAAFVMAIISFAPIVAIFLSKRSLQ